MKFKQKILTLSCLLLINYSSAVVLLVALNGNPFHENFFGDYVLTTVWGLCVLGGALLLSGFFYVVNSKKFPLWIVSIMAFVVLIFITLGYLFPSNGINAGF